MYMNDTYQVFILEYFNNSYKEHQFQEIEKAHYSIQKLIQTNLFGNTLDWQWPR